MQDIGKCKRKGRGGGPAQVCRTYGESQLGSERPSVNEPIGGAVVKTLGVYSLVNIDPSSIEDDEVRQDTELGIEGAGKLSRSLLAVNLAKMIAQR